MCKQNPVAKIRGGNNAMSYSMISFCIHLALPDFSFSNLLLFAYLQIQSLMKIKQTCLLSTLQFTINILKNIHLTIFRFSQRSNRRVYTKIYKHNTIIRKSKLSFNCRYYGTFIYNLALILITPIPLRDQDWEINILQQ